MEGMEEDGQSISLFQRKNLGPWKTMKRDTNRTSCCHIGLASDKPDAFNAYLTGWHLCYRPRGFLFNFFIKCRVKL